MRVDRIAGSTNAAARDALRKLFDLFPDFERWWNDEEMENGLVDGVHLEPTHRLVMMEFLGFFAKRHRSFSQEQLRLFGEWVDGVVEADDELAHAVSTCFLAHSRRARIDRVLAPHLSGALAQPFGD